MSVSKLFFKMFYLIEGYRTCFGDMNYTYDVNFKMAMELNIYLRKLLKQIYVIV